MFKKNFLAMKSLFFLLILSFSVPAIAMADSVEPLDRQFIKSMNEEQRKTRMLLLEQRLDEIKELPRKELNHDQRKALKKEVKDIKKKCGNWLRAQASIFPEARW